jgi:branched-chain amino acid transport system ATP-binding protein
MSLLELNDITASYGPTQALFGVDLSLEAGEVCALMGRNGMGKSSTIKVICRMLKHDRGGLRFDGRDIAGLPSFRAAQAGVGLVPEGRRCFAPLTVHGTRRGSRRFSHGWGSGAIRRQARFRAGSSRCWRLAVR